MNELADKECVPCKGGVPSLKGQALKELGVIRSDVVLATKVFGRMAPGPNDIGASRGHIMDSVSRSLEGMSSRSRDWPISSVRQRLSKARSSKYPRVATSLGPNTA